ncbi:MAG: GAP family protein [Solirubrobacterales bacterium]
MGRAGRRGARTLSDALGQIFAFGIAAGLSPIPIVGVVLILGTPRARANSIAFAISWVVSIFAVGMIAVLVSGGTGATGKSSESGPVIWQVVVGVLLLLLGGRYWRSRPRGDTRPDTPKWMSTIDSFDARRSAALGLALSILNPKNLLLVLSAAGAVTSASLSSGEETLGIVIFTLIATIGVATPIVIFLAIGERSADLLARLKNWLITNNATVMAALCVVLGAYMIFKGTSG